MADDNVKPAQKAHDQIDQILEQADWTVQPRCLLAAR